ncbi:MAG: hypothetical protein J6B72_00970 [Clostridia bacterium]|nr:hypothetical protein [Clostridia bacterium]
MKKQIISLLLTMVMIFSLIPLASFATVAAAPTVDTTWYDTETTDSHPNDLYIYDENDFVAFGAKLGEAKTTPANATAFDGKVIHIMADLDMAGYANWYNSGNKVGRYFNGIIDGHGHVISNLNWECIYNTGTTNLNTNAKYTGLLGGYIIPGSAKNSTYDCYAGVFNLGFVNCSMTTGALYCGGLFGAIGADNSGEGTRTMRFENLYVDVDVTSYAETADSATKGNTNASIYVGGIASYFGKGYDAEMNNVVYAGDIEIKDQTATDRIGGFLGEYAAINGSYKSTLLMKNCAFYGTIDVNDGAYVSGFIGVVSNAIENDDDSFLRFENCIAAGYLDLGYTGNNGVFFKTGNASAKLRIKDCYYIDQFSNNVVLQLNNDAKGTIENLDTNTKVDSPSALAAMEIDGYANMPHGTLSLEAPVPTVIPVGVVNFIWRTNHLKSEGFDTTNYATAFRGFQTKVDGMVYKLRLVGLVNDMNGDGTLDDEYKAVGFDIVLLSHTAADGSQWTSSEPITTVYTSVKAKLDENSDEETSLSAAELGGDNIFVATVGAVPVNVGEVTFIVKTFHDTVDGRVYDDVFTVTYDTAVATNS